MTQAELLIQLPIMLFIGMVMSGGSKKITVNFSGDLITPILEGVFAFSSSDLWLVGSLPIHGDGENWIMYDLRTTVDPNLSLSKAWGMSSDNIYFVGRNGSMALYNKNQWSKIETGTDINFRDIYGSVNKDNSEVEIIALASNSGINQRKQIVRIKDQAV